MLSKKLEKEVIELNKRVIKLILIFCIIVFGISFYLILDQFKSYDDNNKDLEKLTKEVIQKDEETKEVLVDWENLKKVNRDIIAWIEIEGTKINYPILKDNVERLYYLTHTYNKKKNAHGAIFTINLDEEEVIIYGHNMKNGSMFSELSKYLDKNFFQTHSKFKIYTPNDNYECLVFSAYSIGVEEENSNIEKLNFDEKIKYYKEKSEHKIEINTITKLVKLSTCSYLNATTTPTTKRYYIVASMEKIN